METVHFSLPRTIEAKHLYIQPSASDIYTEINKLQAYPQSLRISQFECVDRGPAVLLCAGQAAVATPPSREHNLAKLHPLL
jgi:hypothetical protein